MIGTVASSRQHFEIIVYEFPTISTILKHCILTGNARNEKASIVPAGFDEEAITYPVSVTKNQPTYTFPITPTICNLLLD